MIYLFPFIGGFGGGDVGLGKPRPSVAMAALLALTLAVLGVGSWLGHHIGAPLGWWVGPCAVGVVLWSMFWGKLGFFFIDQSCVLGGALALACVAGAVVSIGLGVVGAVLLLGHFVLGVPLPWRPM